MARQTQIGPRLREVLQHYGDNRTLRQPAAFDVPTQFVEEEELQSIGRRPRLAHLLEKSGGKRASKPIPPFDVPVSFVVPEEDFPREARGACEQEGEGRAPGGVSDGNEEMQNDDDDQSSQSFLLPGAMREGAEGDQETGKEEGMPPQLPSHLQEENYVERIRRGEGAPGPSWDEMDQPAASSPSLPNPPSEGEEQEAPTGGPAHNESSDEEVQTTQPAPPSGGSLPQRVSVPRESFGQTPERAHEMEGDYGDDPMMENDEDAMEVTGVKRRQERRKKRGTPLKRLRKEAKRRNSMCSDEIGLGYENGIRRSTRRHLKPLNYWLNEHVTYDRNHNDVSSLKSVITNQANDPDWWKELKSDPTRCRFSPPRKKQKTERP